MGRRGRGLWFNWRLICMRFVHRYFKLFITIIISILILIFLLSYLWHLSHYWKGVYEVLAKRLWVGGRQGMRLVVEDKVFDKWIQQGMIKYSRNLSQFWEWVHYCNKISHILEGGLTSLVLYLPQAGTAWEGVQDGCLICNRSLHLPWYPAGGGGGEVGPVSFGVGHHIRLCQDIYVGEKGVGQRALKGSTRDSYQFNR